MKNKYAELFNKISDEYVELFLFSKINYNDFLKPVLSSPSDRWMIET